MHTLISLLAAAAIGSASTQEPCTKNQQTYTAAQQERSLHITVSVCERKLHVIEGADTLFTAPVAVGNDRVFSYAGQTWHFRTPRGIRTVLDKQQERVWTAPDWAYAEAAKARGLELVRLSNDRPYRLSDGAELEVRNNRVGIESNGRFQQFPLEAHIMLDDKLFLPPAGSANRKVTGALGHHALDTGDGYLLHGTPYKNTIGNDATHGCLRLHDKDIKWLYDNIPLRTKVYLY